MSNLTHLFFCNQCWRNLCADLRCLFTILSSGRTFLFFLFYDSNHTLHTCEMILLHVRFNSIYDVHGYCRIIKLAVPTDTALAPTKSISMASSALSIPPIPMIGTIHCIGRLIYHANRNRMHGRIRRHRRSYLPAQMSYD